MTKPKPAKPKIYMKNGRWTYTGMPRWVRSGKTTIKWAKAHSWCYARNQALKRRERRAKT